MTVTPYGLISVHPSGVFLIDRSSSPAIWDESDGDDIRFEEGFACKIVVDEDGQQSYDADADDALYVEDWFNDNASAVDGCENLFYFWGEGVAE